MTSRQLYSIDFLVVQRANVEPRGENPGSDAVSLGGPPAAPGSSAGPGPVPPTLGPAIAADPAGRAVDQAADPGHSPGGAAHVNMGAFPQQMAAGIQDMAASNAQIVERLTVLEITRNRCGKRSWKRSTTG